MRPAHRRRPAAGLLLAPLLAPLLTGCFAAGGGSSGAPGSGSPEGARLRIALAFPPSENFSPYGADATLLSRLGVTEGLTRLDGNGAAAPALAESWRRENGRNWLFTLRDATFQDGAPVTADAVAAALTHATEATPVPTALTGVRLTARASGDRTVRVTTATADPVLPLRLAGPSLAVLSPKAYGTTKAEAAGKKAAAGKPAAPDPVGHATGPFMITKVNGSASATLDRYDDYWGGRAQASGIDAKFIADGTARANALRTGEEDIAEAVPVSQAASLPKGVAREVPTARTTSLFLNTRSGVFADPKIRAAARRAVDTSVLAKNVYEGYADPGQGVFGPALNWAQGLRHKPVGRAEPATAAQVKGATVTLATYDNRPELPEVAQVLQQQLEKAGFTVKLTVRESSRIESDALAGKFDAFVGARNTMLDTGDPVSVLASDYTCEGTYNLALLCDKAVDRAVTAADAVADPEERRRAVLAAEARILGTDAVVPLVHQRNVLGVATSVRGVLLDPYERAVVAPGTRR
ncbi:ABC transporter substrate-binding protein [Streptomyces sp. NPDC096310]|uniref:ABC transporter substrate-binding protein n=1 Tax=Streptomyces sp. NPDC096310 TaxID=3366082 RepID=UPI0038080EB7